jgi:HK97 family phage prohead protease
MTTMTRDARQKAREEMRGVRETRRVPIGQFEMREVPNGTGGTNLKFEGYASITCADEDDFSHAYEMEDYIGAYEESVLRGAFTKTLSEGADVAFLVNHDGVTMARTKPGTLRLLEDLVGLHVDATLNPSRSDVQILKAAVSDGAIDEMSFAFRVVNQKWSYKEDNGKIDRRFLQELNLNKGDVSPCNYGANPHTGGLVSMRSRRQRIERSAESSLPLVLPDHTTAARVALARLGHTPGGAKR